MPPFSVNIAEDGGSVTFCVTLITGVLSSGETATVTLTTMDGTLEPGDFTRQQVDLDFSDLNFVKGNEVTSCVNVPIIDDDLCEGTEMFTILLSEADPNVALNGPRMGTVAEIGLRLPVAECEADGVWIRLDYATLVRKGADRVCEVSVRTEEGTAMGGF
jgi:hypothetical protein